MRSARDHGEKIDRINHHTTYLLGLHHLLNLHKKVRIICIETLHRRGDMRDRPTDHMELPRCDLWCKIKTDREHISDDLLTWLFQGDIEPDFILGASCKKEVAAHTCLTCSTISRKKDSLPDRKSTLEHGVQSFDASR